MALTFVSKTEQIKAQNTLNNLTINYTFTMVDGAISGSVEGVAKTSDSRRVMTKQTSDGSSFTGRIQAEKASDNLSGLSTQMKEDLIAIYNDPDSYTSAAEEEEETTDEETTDTDSESTDSDSETETDSTDDSEATDDETESEEETTTEEDSAEESESTTDETTEDSTETETEESETTEETTE